MKYHKTKKNIDEVVKNELCTGCGACQGVCPIRAITFQFRNGLFQPKVEANCNQCGLCYEICPGHEIDYDNLNIRFFGKVPKDIFIGNYEKIWVGHSTNNSIRYNAASGGLVTSLLILALEEGIIDGAAVLGMNENNPLIPKAFIARTPEEIISSIGSKYVSGSVCSIISEILKTEGKYAVVGLPCHLEALRKSEIHIKKLNERIVLHFGLFCQTIISHTGLKFWFKVNKIDSSEITKLSYRGNGWPGGMTIKRKDEGEKFYPLPLYWEFLENFSPIRCNLCVDGLAELADISFGDAWLSEFASDKIGTSIIVVRSKKGNDLIDLAIRNKKLIGREATQDMLLRSQNKMLKFKKEGYRFRAKIRSLLGFKVPIYTGGFIQDSRDSYVKSIVFYLKRYSYEKEFLWNFIFRWNTSIQPRFKKFMTRFYYHTARFVSKILKPFFFILSKMNYLILWHLIVNKKNYPKMVKNVLIINQADMLNKGDAAILTGTMQLVNKAFPDAKAVIVSHTLRVDKPRIPVKVVSSYRFLQSGYDFYSTLRVVRLLSFVILYRLTNSCKIFRLPIINYIANETLIQYAKADIVIHRGGDNLTEDYGMPYLYFESIFISILMRKPTIILGESIGPFTTRTSKRLAEMILNNVDVIIAREKLSIDVLHKLKIFKPRIFLLPDIAFVLQPSSIERLQILLNSENLKNLRRPVIAISISSLIARYAFTDVMEDQKIKHLISAMTNTIEYCQKKIGATFVFIPHVIGEGNDDRVISRQIVDKLNNHKDTFVIEGEYSHEDFRAFLLEYAEFIIGSRMHANIAAISVGVPTLALAYGQKTHGIIGEMFGLSDFVIDVREVKNGEDLFIRMISKIDNLWDHRDMIKQKLVLRAIEIKNEALKSGEILGNFYLEKNG